MALVVFANGNTLGKGTHVVVRTAILRGEYDAELKWPFVGKVTYTLLNQLEDGNHHTQIQTFDTIRNARVNSNWGRPKFIPLSALAYDPVKNTQYLKDDKLFFRVTVEMAGHKPWLVY